MTAHPGDEGGLVAEGHDAIPFGGLGAALPFGSGGLNFNPEYIRVDTNPRTLPGGVAITGRFERVALRLRYPLVLTRQQSLDLSGGLDLVAETTIARAFGQPLSQDRLRVLHAELGWNRRLSEAQGISADVLVAQGLAGLGARGADDVVASWVPLSRQGSQPDFTKVGARLAQLSVDSGASVRLELVRPVPLGAGGQIVPYGFSAYGLGHLARPTIVELANIDAWSLGAGLRFAAGGSALGSFGQIEVSRNHQTAAPGDSTRITASLTSRF